MSRFKRALDSGALCAGDSSKLVARLSFGAQRIFRKLGRAVLRPHIVSAIGVFGTRPHWAFATLHAAFSFELPNVAVGALNKRWGRLVADILWHNALVLCQNTAKCPRDQSESPAPSRKVRRLLKELEEASSHAPVSQNGLMVCSTVS